MKNWKKWFSWLISPMAVGLVITGLTIWLTLIYYQASESGNDDIANEGITGFILATHQWSIDHRLKVRGPREVSPNLALLTVDEKAVSTLGRWPWSRQLLGRAIDQAINDGAKVLAFDMVFSEPENNPATIVLDKSKGKLTSPTTQILEKLAAEIDADKALAAILTKHTDHIVAGAFANSYLTADWPPETEFCRDLIFKRGATFKQWDKEEVLLGVTDPYQPYIPTLLANTFSDILTKREGEIRNEFGQTNSKVSELDLQGKLAVGLNQVCDTLLEDYKEGLNEAWSSVVAQENSAEFKFPSYDSWLEDYRSRVQPSLVPFSYDWVLNTATISAGTKHTGHFNTEQDTDGSIRSKSLFARTANSYFPALSLKAFLVANGMNANISLQYRGVSRKKEIVDVEITNNESGESVFKVPTDGRGKLMINYAGSQEMFPYLSFAELLNGKDEMTITQQVRNPKNGKWQKKELTVKRQEFMKDKIFVVGATATGIYDLRVTPFQENFPGAETHLNVIDNLIQKNFFRTMPNEPVKMVFLLSGLGLILSIGLSYLGAAWGFILTSSMLATVYFVDRYFLFSNGIVATVIWPLFLIAMLYVSLTFYRYLTEERGKKELRQTFQKYVSPAIVEEILAHPQNVELGGRKAHLTVFFSDVRGFTTISEKLDPRALSDLLNSYLTPMTDIVFKNRGTLDKYMGDAIMAFFGAPIPYTDHAKHACRCALQTIDKLLELQKEFERKGLPSIDIGIGLNTGEVSVGNMGSVTVRSYTVMGDAVNLASRLEGINKEYGTRIILSEMTYNEVKDNFVCREVDWVRVKGKILPVKIYELIAEERVPDQKVAEMLKWFKEGYEHYHARQWKPGLDAFSKALDLNPTDEVSKLYIERCQGYIVSPPPDEWDGVFVMKTK